jgi:very-short-patch-repair endonuclease
MKDHLIYELAAKQHGLVTRAQLMEASVSRHIIDRRLRSGLLRAIHAGVYQVGPVVAPRARELAAVLACAGGTVSHQTAAALWELLPAQNPYEPVHVTLRHGQHCGRRPGINAHRSAIASDEIARIENIPVTSAARTILDLSEQLSERKVEQALAHAERQRIIRQRDVLGLLDRYPRRAARTMRSILGRDAPPAFTRSVAEDRLLGLMRTAALPEPELNVIVEGIEIDCYWRTARLAIEIDGYEYHKSTRAFVRDRQRDSALAAAGIQVIRLSWQQVDKEREKTLVQIAQALARRL